MDCPTPLEMSSYLARILPPEREAAVEAHAGSCDACCDSLRVLTDPHLNQVQAPPLRTYIRAAALLLAASLALLCWKAADKPGLPSPLPEPASGKGPIPPAYPSSPTSLPTRGWASEGVDIVPGPGTDAELLRDASGRPLFRLASGSAWIAASQPLSVRVPGSPAQIRGEAFLEVLSTPPSFSSLLLGQAWADESVPTVRLVLLDGSAAWMTGERKQEAQAGTEVLFFGQEIRAQPVPLARLEALRRERLRRLAAFGDSRDLLGPATRMDTASPVFAFREPLPSHYRLLISLEGRSPGTEIALEIPTKVGIRRWTAMLPARRAGDATEIELLSDGSLLRGRVDGTVALESPLADAARVLEPLADGASPRIRCWGGSVTLVRVRLLPLPGNP
jgi:hypothetical protein